MNEPDKAIEKSKSGLVIHKSFMYEPNTGRRLIYRGGRAWDPETEEELMERFSKGQDISLDDLTRICQVHPILLQYAKQGKDYMQVIVGTVERVPFKSLMKDAGFDNWGTFRAMTDFACPGLRKLFELAQEQRQNNRLERAEEALEKRAIEGVDEEVYAPNGKFVGTRKKYSDRLLEIHLKALDPDTYSEKHQHAISGTVVSVNLGLRDGQQLPEAQDVEVIEDEEAV